MVSELSEDEVQGILANWAADSRELPPPGAGRVRCVVKLPFCGDQVGDRGDVGGR